MAAESLIEAIQRIQKVRDETEADYTEDEIDMLDSEPFGRHFGTLDGLDTALDILQSLAHGLTPAQGIDETEVK